MSEFIESRHQNDVIVDDTNRENQKIMVMTTERCVRLIPTFRGDVEKISVFVQSKGENVIAESISVRFNGKEFNTIKNPKPFFQLGISDMFMTTYQVQLVPWTDPNTEDNFTVVNFSKIDVIEVVVNLSEHSLEVKVECTAGSLCPI